MLHAIVHVYILLDDFSFFTPTIQCIPKIIITLEILLINLLKFYYLIASGNNLAKIHKVTKECLEEYLVDKTMEDCQFENQNEKITIIKKIDLLKEKLNVQSPISPYGLFSITHSSFLHVLVNVLTYVAIIITVKSGWQNVDPI